MGDIYKHIYTILYRTFKSVNYEHLKDEYVEVFKLDKDKERFLENTKNKLNEVLFKIFESKTYRELEEL